VIEPEDLELLRAGIAHATATHTGGALDGALDELGWRDAHAADERAAVSVLFELQGAAGAASSALDFVLATALGVDPAPDLAVALPPMDRWHPPGRAVAEGVAVDGLATAALARSAAAVVAHDRGFVVVDAASLGPRPAAGLDEALGLVAVSGEMTGAPAAAGGAWADAVAAGQRALAHELVGASRAMLQLARDHAVERIQFGVPISSFQAVRHRLAEAYVAVEAAAEAAGAAWDDGTPFTASLAKALAGRSARTVARHCQQVLAGIGFTAEHPFHRHLRRSLVLDHLLGSSKTITRSLGEDLLRTRTVPALHPL
jgi:alkylation response protein AidB-like acyl-CoA dehydrogenase